MFTLRISMAIFSLAAIIAGGCATRSYDAIPDALESQVDHAVSFSQLKQSPDAYRGRVVMFGGEVLSAKRLKEGTRIEVLQLPLDGSFDPAQERTSSEGRFIALQKEFLDPATLPAGTRVTVTGEVTGATTLPLDETQYTYPTLDVKNLTVWPRAERYRSRPYYSYPYYGPYGGPYGFYGPYGRWRGGYPYWW